MKTLCIFANEFPYGTLEPYLGTEIFYHSNFDKVLILALQLRDRDSKTIREIPSNAEVIPIRYAPKWVYFVNSLKVLFDKNLYKELQTLKRDGRISFKRIVDLFVFLSRAHFEAKQIYTKLNCDLSNAVFYSYRFEYQPYVAFLLKKKLGVNAPIISRAHRYDLYEEFRKNKYIPLRNIILEYVYRVYPCSKDGTDYLKRRHPEYSKKIETRYLGSVENGTEIIERKEKTLRIVSCSTAQPVKRLDLLVEGLSRIKSISVEWTHFGDGPLLDNVKTMSKKMFGDNIKATFRGNVPNNILLDDYHDNSYDYFVNVSESEGLPVSIMEAMSFGIPCIATDVGGTNEIIDNGINGFLLNPRIEAEDLYNKLMEISAIDREAYLSLRKKAREKWEQSFSADINYQKYACEMIEMVYED